jgi:GNAT superfamily N-acetyltransferase
MIVAAFYDDPTWSWAFPDAGQRRAQHREFWRMFVDAALRFPWVWLAPRETSTSVWIPPGEVEMTEEQGEELERLVTDLLDAPKAERVLRAFELFEDAHPRDQEHYYLSLLATDPRQSGHGYGLGLLAANLAVIDEEGVPAYLEASNPANVPLYERHGFRVVGHFDLPDDGPRVHTMWRDPRGPAERS